MASTKFNINLEGIELNKAQVASLNKEINALVLKHVGSILGPETPVGYKIIKNPEWLGIWIKRFASIEKLKLAKETFKQQKLG